MEEIAIKIDKSVKDLENAVDTSAYLIKPLVDWREQLAEECQVYVYGENYIAKRFDAINFKFCSVKEATEVLNDNLYALLRFKYFPKLTEEIDKRIDDIVKSFTRNLKTTLKKISFDKNTDSIHVNMIPNYCQAFRNGVYDFKNNCWLFKYDILRIEALKNNIYLYDNKYVILWYFDFNFEPLPFGIFDLTLQDFIDVMKETSKKKHNYCFELMYNIAHDNADEFSLERFNHLCEILGYTILQDFSQNFVLLIGSGQNGKNSLFDGCFSNRVVPKPVANSLDDLEQDDFITGALENKYHNIFLETSPKTYTESTMLKAITGSMDQTIHHKGIDKYQGVINTKFIYAGNDQEKIKFSDSTTGFRRRINIFEIWYHWDAQKKFMKKGDYYDTTFSDSLYELKEDMNNTIIYIYFAMYGLLSATKDFTVNFKFSTNDWRLSYSDADIELKETLQTISSNKIVNFMKNNEEEGKVLFYSMDKKKLYTSRVFTDLGYKDYKDLIDLIDDDEKRTAFFVDYDVYISLRSLQKIMKFNGSSTSFTQNLKKIYNDITFEPCYNNKLYVKITFVDKRLKIIN